MYKIYKIVDNTNDNVYIGITTKTLKRRLAQHRCDKDCLSRDIIKNNDYKIELIEETDDKMRERYWILNTNCINITIPGRTKKEYYEDNREYLEEKKRENRKNNIDKVREHDRKRNTIRNKWMSSMGGRPNVNNMSLLKIDPYLFN